MRLGEMSACSVAGTYQDVPVLAKADLGVPN